MKSIIEDDGLKLTTPQASASLVTATNLFQWMDDELNNEIVMVFAKKYTKMSPEG